MDPGVMVLAAGQGSRLAGASGGLPKPLMTVAGRSLLQWNLDWLAAAGFREPWINLHHGGELIRGAVGDGADRGLSIRYSMEPELLGTAGGWRQVATLAGAPRRWLVVYGDNVMRFDLSALLATHGDATAEGRPAATVALFDPGRHANTGLAGGWVVLAPDGRIRSFVEGGGRIEGGLVNAGVYVLEPDVLEAIPAGAADFGRDVLPALAAAGRLRGHVLEPGGFCLGVDTPEALRAAEHVLAAAAVRA